MRVARRPGVRLGAKMGDDRAVFQGAVGREGIRGEGREAAKGGLLRALPQLETL